MNHYYLLLLYYDSFALDCTLQILDCYCKLKESSSTAKGIWAVVTTIIKNGRLIVGNLQVKGTSRLVMIAKFVVISNLLKVRNRYSK